MDLTGFALAQRKSGRRKQNLRIEYRKSGVRRRTTFQTRRFAPLETLRYHFHASMYDNFYAIDRWSKRKVHCIQQKLIVAIATRHADATDIEFLVDGRPVWVALPLPAWVEYKKRSGKTITDPLAVEVAGHYLKTALESGEGGGREMYSLTVAETLKHLDQVVRDLEQPVSQD